ncbi:MAG: epimerase [Halioglobus sp.]|nr:epimerase [Halioglobus sp.]|tara:strand:+ start:408 stop:1316 length:909 start_codon:yes stop_codon:yes gene_type:complete
MKIIVVGGTGLVGGNVALLLKSLGHEVTLMARKPSALPVLADFPFIAGDYAEDDFGAGQLQGFDWMVFAAAVDIRYVPTDGSVTAEAFYEKYNTLGVPRFFAAARAAGIRRCVYVGTFYPTVAPERIDVCPYVRSRHLADQAIRAMSDDAFVVCCIDAPFILGLLPGLDIPHLAALVQYAKGSLEGLPVFAPRGGTNHVSVTSVSQAIVGALERGESGRAYLVGDENYSWKEYLELWFDAVGNPTDLEVREEDHPMLPDAIMFAGVGATVSYEPDPAEVERLGYDRGAVRSLIVEVAKHFGG